MDETHQCSHPGCDRSFDSKRGQSVHERRSHESEKPWQSRDRLEQLYHEEELSIRDIADELGTGYKTIRRWMKRHDIERRPSKKSSTGDWQNEDRLRDLYETRGYSSTEIAEQFGVTAPTVRYWLNKHGIETRDPTESRVLRQLRQAAPFELNAYGYEIWRTKLDGETWRVKAHRLLAVAEWGFEETAGKVVHHQNEIPWDNRPENLELMTPAEHIREHKPSEGWE